jgi:GTP-binding protein
MKVKAKFLISATDAPQFPESSLPEIVFLGRSNVGKSSLLNSLAGMKIAHVSSTPGRTRTINFFAVSSDPKRTEPTMLFVDLPGYGYAKLSAALMAEWAKVIESYLKKRRQIAVSIVIIDLSVPAQKSDLQLLEFLRAAKREFIIVGTKADKLSNNQLRAILRRFENQFGVESILHYSAKTGSGRKDLWREISSRLL